MPLLFSYGTLQEEDVQRSLMGRRLDSQPDELPRFTKQWLTHDGERIANVKFTADAASRVAGVVLEVTEDELRRIDEYERPYLYERVELQLASQRKVWVYVRRAAVTLTIAFVDLARYAVQSESLDDAVVAEVIDRFYGLVGDAVRNGGGVVLKFIGDAALIVFPEAATERASATLNALKTSVDQMMESRGWQCRLIVRLNQGTVIAGAFGVDGERRLDIIGKAVNATARMRPSQGM